MKAIFPLIFMYIISFSYVIAQANILFNKSSDRGHSYFVSKLNEMIASFFF